MNFTIRFLILVRRGMVKESSRGTISSLMTPSKCFNFCNDISPACATCPETPCIRPRARDRG